MTDINVPPPIVPQEWEKIDTSIDGEAPASLSPDQFARYCATLRDLLRAAGLPVQDYGHKTADYLVLQDEDLDLHMRIRLGPDRMAGVEVRIEEDLVEMPDTVRAASRLVRLFEAARSFERTRPRLS